MHIVQSTALPLRYCGQYMTGYLEINYTDNYPRVFATHNQRLACIQTKRSLNFLNTAIIYTYTLLAIAMWRGGEFLWVHNAHCYATNWNFSAISDIHS